MAFRYDDIGNRLKAFRMSSELSADEIAQRIGISRTALYRLEKGELVKLETLESLAELLEVSVPTLLGVGFEYLSSAVAYFERLRQLEETAEQIFVLAGPIPFLLASDEFTTNLATVLEESVPDDVSERQRTIQDVHKIMGILRERETLYKNRGPNIVSLMSALNIERFLRSGFAGRPLLSEEIVRQRRDFARREVAHFAQLMENEEIGVQIGLVTGALPHTGFQIFRQPERKVLSVSPFRLGEQTNIRVGVAMITSAPEALMLHEKSVKEMWKGSLKGPGAAEYLREMLASDAPETQR